MQTFNGSCVVTCEGEAATSISTSLAIQLSIRNACCEAESRRLQFMNGYPSELAFGLNPSKRDRLGSLPLNDDIPSTLVDGGGP